MAKIQDLHSHRLAAEIEKAYQASILGFEAQFDLSCRMAKAELQCKLAVAREIRDRKLAQLQEAIPLPAKSEEY